MKNAIRVTKGLIAMFAFATSLASSLACGQAPENATMLVLDASGSMWGQIDGVTKIEIARDVVAAMVNDWNPEHHLGLIAYGHRREGDCDDIETLIPIGTIDAEGFRSTLNSVKPKGKTPLSAAVQQAASVLDFESRTATVILVSDGRETCGLDPCVVADQLEKAGIDFTAHVIGFDINAPQDIAQLECMAERTGGRYLAAKDASSLAQAMEEVVEEVRAESILFVAAMEKGGQPLTNGVSWTVTEPDADFEGNYKKIRTTGAAQPRLKLDNGSYRVVTRRGSAKVVSSVTVDDTTESVEVILGAGELALRAVLNEGAELLDKGVAWNVYESEIAFDGSMKKVTTTGATQPSLTLPAGEYRVVATKGEATATEIVTVIGGGASVAVFNLNAADLRTTATLDQGGDVIKSGVAWDVTKAEPDIGGGYERLTTTGASIPTFTLPAGKHRLVARKGQVRTTKVVELNPGEQVQRSVVLNAAEVSAVTSLATGGEPLTKGVSWHVFSTTPDADGSLPKITTTGAAQARFTLPVGQYRLRVQSGEASAETVIDLTAGAMERVSVVLDAAIVATSATAGEGGSEIKRGLVWEVWDDATGNEPTRVAVTGAAQPTFTLASGTYRLVAKQRQPDASAQSTITVSAGEMTRIVLPIAAAATSP